MQAGLKKKNVSNTVDKVIAHDVIIYKCSKSNYKSKDIKRESKNEI